MTIPIFDGHNDVLFRLEQDPSRSFADCGDSGHIDVAKAHAGGFAGGLFAMFTANPELLSGGPRDRSRPYGPLESGPALRSVVRQFGVLKNLEAAGHLRVTTDVNAIEAAMADGVMAAVPHLEGAEAIVDVADLEALHGLGLRSLGPVWSRPNRFATGVPFAFPGTPDVGPGLTHAGAELVKACNRLGIMVDVSHLNEAGFWDVLELSEAPVAASHSNVHSLAASPRNLTDRQLDALAERDGLVGINFGVGFLREDGAFDSDTPLETVVRHADALIERLGESRVAFGSDFDGAMMPGALAGVQTLPKLLDTFREHGYDDTLLKRIAHLNWLDLLRRVW
jgi:membrane dipeptidase